MTKKIVSPKSSEFSKFIRTASLDEKLKVWHRVIKKSVEEQNDQKAKSSDAGPSK